MNLDKMTQEAEQRISYFINRSAGQHVRAMRAHWQAQQQPTIAFSVDSSSLAKTLQDSKTYANALQDLIQHAKPTPPTASTPLQLAAFGVAVAAAVATIIIICSQRAGLDVIYSILTWGL